MCSAPNAQKEQIALKLARLCHNCLSSNNQGYWRHSKETAKVYRCKNQRNRATSNDICKGYQSSDGRKLQSEEIDNMYCDANHRGPLCKVCLSDTERFNPQEGHCEKCPPTTDGVSRPIFVRATVPSICIGSGVRSERG